MVAVLTRSWFVATLVLTPVALANAQLPFPGGHPSPQQVQTMLQNDPGLADKVRAKIAASGLTEEQIHARLKAAGYPEGLLDDYMPSRTGASAGGASPGDDVLGAVRFLGLVDSTEALARERPAPDSSARRAEAPPDAAAKPEDRIFGLDVFRRSTSQFEPDLAGAVDASYRVGPRDVLALIITGEVEKSYTLDVTREGFVVIPQIGQLYVANLTLAQINDAVYRKLQDAYSGVGRDPGARTHVYITVAKLHTNQVFVVGDAMAPGSYQVSSLGTILTALYAAGGPSDNGSVREIQLRRAGKTVSQLDVYDYLTKGDASQDARLETGDVVFVPVHGPRVRVEGQVVRPATYELRPGETLKDLTSMAGGFTAQANLRHVLIRRILPPAERRQMGRDRTVLDITSDDLATGVGPEVALADGDVVEVSGVSDKVRNLISVSGAVWNPGSLGFTPGMKLSDAIRRAGGVHPDVRDLLVTRTLPDYSKAQLRASFLDTAGTLASDFVLQEDDSVQVFGASDFRPDRYVAITGAVPKGGRFAWRDGMTLRDLVQLAGGLDDGAYLVQAEVARLPEQARDGVTARTITVPLDSTYLFERGFDGQYVGPPGVPAPSTKAAEFTLAPYDNVLILRQPDWELDRTVTILGEVKFPGTYTLTSKDERISKVIERAGGLTNRAYIAGAVFTRPQGNLGRVGVDLDAAMREPGSRDNFVMMSGDSLYVPRYRPTVKIEGAVNSPIAVAYVPGYKLTDYVSAAGGASYTADLKRAYVRQPNGIVDSYRRRVFFLPDHNPTPEAGSVVTVPVKDPNDRKDWTAITGSVAQVLASTVAIVAIILRK